MSDERTSYTLILTATITVSRAFEPVDHNGRVFAFREVGTDNYYEPLLKVARFVGVDDGRGKVLREKESRELGITTRERSAWLLPDPPPLQRPRK